MTDAARAAVEHEQTCVYCTMPLAPSHEHDHFPFPKRHGGDTTVCVCTNCHTLKDRIRFDDLGAAVIAAMVDATPLVRITVAKMFTFLLDETARRKAAEGALARTAT